MTLSKALLDIDILTQFLLATYLKIVYDCKSYVKNPLF
jgi:hypothetical protein